MTGTINYLKHHLTKIQGDVQPCGKVPVAVKEQIWKAMEVAKGKQVRKERIFEEIGRGYYSFYVGRPSTTSQPCPDPDRDPEADPEPDLDSLDLAPVCPNINRRNSKVLGE
ncbi:hypothetical protein AMTR_s00142p00024020 [Amborella trichopoda]|uniref:Uncharacterized protein n=1 Tax=Amborella trichopoda TaxID=13333 RepID=W1P805_AMBTC|nr:hypothetical protein AMTR_s00142p00024020 [Amborella trichopoda]